MTQGNMHSKSLPFESKTRESKDNRLNNPDFELAYQAMIGDLAPSFLHELNNPLTVLASSVGLLGKLAPPDTDFAEIMRNISDGSRTLINISESYRRILKAKTALGVNHPEALCEEMIQILGYRFKNESLAPVLSADQNICEIGLSTKEFYFSIYSVLLMCLHIFAFLHTDKKTEHILRIRFENGGNGHCRLTMHLPGVPSRELPKAIPEPPKAFSSFLPAFLEKQASEFFHFVIKQTLRIFQGRKIGTVWEVGHRKMKLQLTLPCTTPDLRTEK